MASEVCLRSMHSPVLKNRVFDGNKKAFHECIYYYHEVFAFDLGSNEVCLDMGKYKENVHTAISAELPLFISFNTKNLKVEKIVYPNINRFAG